VTAVITVSKLAPAFDGVPSLAVLTSPNVKLARALVTQRFFDREFVARGAAQIDPSARIAPSARIGAQVYVGPGATIGEDCVVLPNAVIEERAVVGARTVLHPTVVVGYECVLGDDVIVRAGTVIGSEGFGFAQDETRRSHRIPQMGNVVIGDGVVIGSNCCIDRGTHGSTRIGKGTVMDNLCHIAHNVEIGENCILTAMLCVAGSTKIGNRVLTSGQVGILDHLTIGDDVALVQRAGVSSDVKTAGAYGGVPLLPLGEYRKNQATLRKLTSLRSTIKDLSDRIAKLEADRDDK
jgi:UDP-3-O-[3-hydroxymyristoyl] glucosamine N-acyltransferase